MGNGDFAVYISRNHKFKYFDDKKADKDFTPPTRRVEMKLPDFMKKLKDWKRGDERYSFV